MRSKTSLVLTLLWSVLITAFAEEESITITTYYPSPYGIYNQMQANSLGIGDNNKDGNLDNGDVPTTAGDVWIRGNVGIGTDNPLEKLSVAGNLDLQQNIIKNAKIEKAYYKVGTTLLKSDDNLATPPAPGMSKMKEIRVPTGLLDRDHAFRISYTVELVGNLCISGGCWAFIGRNGGSNVGGGAYCDMCAPQKKLTIVADIGGWRPGDTIEIWGLYNTIAPAVSVVTNFRVYGDIQWEVIDLSGHSW